jgi:hypothetical protein
MRTCNSDTKRLGCVEPSARPTKGECTPRGFEHVGKTILCGRAKRSKKEPGEPEAEEGMEDEVPNDELDVSGGAHRQRGW